MKLSEKATLYSELRASANELIDYVSYASSKEIADVTAALNGIDKNIRPTSSAINELLLSNNEPIPLFFEAKKKFAADPNLTKSINFSETAYTPFSNSPAGRLKDKTISLAYHGANEQSSNTSVLTDISALFCSIVPTTEMSLCTPYLEIKIVYPVDNIGSSDINIPKLNILKFVGTNRRSSMSIPTSTDQPSKYGFDVVGMEIFNLPQTLAPTSDFFKTTQAYQERGVDVLDPISPLMTVENANIQQVGMGGGLITQTKINLSLILHDRSRLSDIEPLITAEIFPLVTFRVTYGWIHPDSNKMTGSVYAKFLNSMKTSQDYSVVSVSVSTRDSLSLKVDLTLVGTATQTMKSAKILSANGNLIPYSSLNSMIKQFIALKSDKTQSNNSTPTFSGVGSTIISSVSKTAASTKFIKVEDFYRLYSLLKSDINANNFQEVVRTLQSLTTYDFPTDDFQKLFEFKKRTDDYGSFETSVFQTRAAAPAASFISNDLNDQIKRQAKESLNLEVTDVPSAIIPLAEMLSHLVAKPLLVALPDLDEVRIHCFSFNTACGRMAGENIGNFPINKSEILQSKEIDINPNTPVQTIINELTKNVNNPGSIFFGFSAEYDRTSRAVQELRASLATASGSSAEEIEGRIEESEARGKADVDEKNAQYLREKNITGITDLSFVPPRVKILLDVLPAYDDEANRFNPTKKIARIMVYDERCKGFSKLGNLLFSMMNSNGIAKIDSDKDVVGGTPLLQGTDVNNIIRYIGMSNTKDSSKMFTINDKKEFRRIVSNLYPTLTIGSEGTLVTNATFSSQPSGEMQSSYFLTAIKEQRGSSYGADSDSALLDDVFIIPSSVSLTMVGNICMTIGQIYYIDFNTGTTLDNAYIVTSVSHTIRPGEFTTSVTLAPMSSASVRTVKRQIQELVVKIQDKYEIKGAQFGRAFLDKTLRDIQFRPPNRNFIRFR